MTDIMQASTEATIALLTSIFTGVNVAGVPGDWIAEYQGHIVQDPDLVSLFAKVWQANA